MPASPPTSSLAQLLRQNDHIRDAIAHRLRRVDEELSWLDALRDSLSAPSPALHGKPTQRTVRLPSAAVEKNRKRSRDEDGAVLFLTVSSAPLRSADRSPSEPFEYAGLYAAFPNAIAQSAAVQLSEDAKTTQQLLALFPRQPATGVRKTVRLSAAAASRIARRMREVGLAEGAEYRLGKGTQGSPNLRVKTGLDERDLQRLQSGAMSADAVETLRTSLFSDLGAFQSCLHAALAECAVAQSATRTERRRAVQLLGTTSLFMSAAEAVGETFAQCCRCRDRDVMESTLVQWAGTLLCASPQRLRFPPSPQLQLYIGLCNTLLESLATHTVSRRGYLRYVLAACCAGAPPSVAAAPQPPRESATRPLESRSPSLEREEEPAADAEASSTKKKRRRSLIHYSSE